jgi:hypothetical protein
MDGFAANRRAGPQRNCRELPTTRILGIPIETVQLIDLIPAIGFANRRSALWPDRCIEDSTIVDIPVTADPAQSCDLLHCGAVYTAITFTNGDRCAFTISGRLRRIATIEEDS